jgi:predicted TIM-barrel fold metal-dependent hydrolase
MFIDAHSHMFQELYTCSKSPPNVQLEGIEIHSREKLPESVREIKSIDIEGFLRGLDNAGIDYVITVAQDMTRSMECWVGSNALAADLQLKGKGRIIGIAGGEPVDKYDRFNFESYRNFEYYIKEKGLKGLFFSPTYEHFCINDRRAYPFYMKAMELDVPMYIHQGLQYNPPPEFTPLEYGRLWMIDQVAIDFPDLRINVEHMAFPWTQELLAIMAHSKNLYTDISDMIRRPTILAWNIVMAKEYKVLDRVMYGSDHVGNDMQEYFEKVEKEIAWCRNELKNIINRAGWPTITEEEINGILMDNAIRFLKLNKR